MDMLVKLYDLPKSCAVFERLREQGIHIRRALAAEKHKIAAWVRENLYPGTRHHSDLDQSIFEPIAPVAGIAGHEQDLVRGASHRRRVSEQVRRLMACKSDLQ